jgi:putative peptide zinc metalloprotease protein
VSNASPPIESGSTAELRPSARLTLKPLSVVPEGDEYVIGDRATGVFFSVPEIGVEALRALEAGLTIEAAAEMLAEQAGTEVNVLEFAEVLLEAGFVVAIDGVSLGVETAEGSRPLGRISSPIARGLFSPAAWLFYAMVFIGCGACFVAKPALWPALEDFFFYPNPAACIAVMTILGIALAAVHELCHVLAARAAGVGARLRISRRMFLPVIETDVSQLWGVPPAQRYGPFLAGMAFDTLLLGSCLGLRLAWIQGLISPPALLLRLAAALALRQVLILGFQCLVFLRTDLYAVLITALGCRNLFRVSILLLKRIVGRLNDADRAELANARPRDVAVARWFAVTYVVGGGFLWWFFVKFFIPGTVMVALWMFLSLGRASLGSSAFWQALVVGLFATFQAVVPLAIFLVERLRARASLAR